MNKRLHLIIQGRVHGVNFRYHTRRKAQQLGLTGWVRNNPDGTVEAVFEGSEEKLKEILEFCKQGPESARVEKVEENWEDFKGEFDEFKHLTSQ